MWEIIKFLQENDKRNMLVNASTHIRLNKGESWTEVKRHRGDHKHIKFGEEFIATRNRYAPLYCEEERRMKSE